MSYSVEGTLQLGLTDVPRRLRLAATLGPLFLLLAIFSAVFLLTLLTRGWSRLAGAQGPEQFEAQSRQPQLLDQIRYRGLLQIADHLASYEQSRQLLKQRNTDSADYASHFFPAWCDLSYRIRYSQIHSLFCFANFIKSNKKQLL